jgi:hypothetical protein
MNILVRVDTGDDTPIVVCDGGHATPFLGLWVARTAGRVDKTGSRPGSSGASTVTIHPTGCATTGPASLDRHLSSRTPEGSSRSAGQTKRDEPCRMLAATPCNHTNIIPADRRWGAARRRTERTHSCKRSQAGILCGWQSCPPACDAVSRMTYPQPGTATQVSRAGLRASCSDQARPGGGQTARPPGSRVP